MVQRSRSQKLNGLGALEYIGVLPSSPTNFIIEQRDPTTADYRNVYVGDIWLNNATIYPPPGTPPTAANLWILVDVSNHIATWINFGSGGTGNLRFLEGNSGGPVGPTAGGIINVVGDGITVDVVGTPGTNTLLISLPGGGTALTCGFLYGQDINVPNATGDGTVYELGNSRTLSIIFDVGANVFPGDGAGTPARFVAPFTAKYYLEISVQLTNLQTGVFNDSIATYNIVTPARTYTAQFSPLGMFTANAMVADSGSMTQGFFMDLTAGDAVTFNCMSNLNGAGGVRDIGVGGSLDPLQTFIAGFIVTGGSGGGGSGTVQFLEGNTGGPVGPTAGGIINVVGDGTTITAVGTPGTNTLTLSVIGGILPSTSCAFLAIQESTVGNVTGDGTTYQLGALQVLTSIFDIGSNVFVGDGLGAPATFTAPATGTYWLEISVQLTNLLTGVFNDSIGTYNVVTPNRTYTFEFSPLGLFTANAMVANTGSIAQGLLADLTIGDVVTFNCVSNLNGAGGVKNIGIGGSADPAQTFICGFIVSGGGGGGVTSVTAGDNINISGADPAHNPIINLNETIQWPNTNNAFTTGVIFLNSNSFMHNFGTHNTFLGTNTGNNTLTPGTADDNTGIGYLSLNALSLATQNTAVGSFSGWHLTTGNANTIMGYNAMEAATTALHNVAIGAGSIEDLTTGGSNTVVGYGAGSTLITGSNNIFVGTSAGSFYTGAESSNIMIGNIGSAADANTIRIGMQGAGSGQQNTAFVAGIYGSTVGATNAYVVIDSSGQLGTTSSSLNNYVSVNTSPYVAASTGLFISVDCSGGAITIQLPNAPTTGTIYTIKDRTGSSATNNITVTTVGGVVLIDAAASYTINTNYAAIRVLFGTAKYQIF